MNQDKLKVVEQEMARVNTDILAIRELKWTGMDKSNSDDHYVYYCGQESLQRNGVALIERVTLLQMTIIIYYCGQESLKRNGVALKCITWVQTQK